ncbi:MAG: phosphoglycerate kinase [Clostridiales bacterium]|nr:phosphoglycerate kinase [Clostridiales bacterium]
MAKKTMVDLDLKGKRVLLRSEFNVPIKDGKVGDDTRIQAELPTIRYIMDQGAGLIIMTHLGRPKGKPVEDMSVKPIAAHLSALLNREVTCIPYGTEESIKAAADAITPGQITLLENTRFWPQEEKNDPAFSRFLASLGDIYINDAFGAAHRAHCSTEGVGQFIPASAGFLMEKEIAFLLEAVENPKQPFVVVMGGSKVSDKISLIENLANKADSILFGGAMANTLLAAKGCDMGTSKIESDKLDLSREMMERVEKGACRIVYPEDLVAADSFSDDAEKKTVPYDKVPAGWMALDIGPATVKAWAAIFAQAGTIIWNGPLGVYEMPSFAKGSDGVAKAMAESSAITIVGGGDAVAAVIQAGYGEKMTHLSTGGGASLELLEGKKLPGIEILQDKD